MPQNTLQKTGQGPRKRVVIPASKAELCNEFLRVNECNFQKKFNFVCPYAHSYEEVRQFVTDQKLKNNQMDEDEMDESRIRKASK